MNTVRSKTSNKVAGSLKTHIFDCGRKVFQLWTTSVWEDGSVFTSVKWYNKIMEGADNLCEYSDKLIIARVMAEMTAEARKHFFSEHPKNT